MKTRNLLVFVALLAFAGSALAALSPENAKWGEGPVQFLMTKEEAAQWKTLQTDAEADAFMTVFWARRGGVAAREDQEARWKYSDEKFSAGKMKGSMSDRGKILSLFGVPTKVLRAGGQGASTITSPTTAPGSRITAPGDVDAGGADSKNAGQQIWVYEGDAAMKYFGVGKVELRFLDRFNTGEFKMETPRVDFGTAR
ncbi:MAG TPA: GWxTD domain-containing protein, partial [Thermoanaerobaculia bacterium]|nr:GWxTD domain-containing protein [Thermoanaerobaculia bacterium]